MKSPQERTRLRPLHSHPKAGGVAILAVIGIVAAGVGRCACGVLKAANDLHAALLDAGQEPSSETEIAVSAGSPVAQTVLPQQTAEKSLPKPEVTPDPESIPLTNMDSLIQLLSKKYPLRNDIVDFGMGAEEVGKEMEGKMWMQEGTANGSTYLYIYRGIPGWYGYELATFNFDEKILDPRLSFRVKSSSSLPMACNGSLLISSSDTTSNVLAIMTIIEDAERAHDDIDKNSHETVERVKQQDMAKEKYRARIEKLRNDIHRKNAQQRGVTLPDWELKQMAISEVEHLH